MGGESRTVVLNGANNKFWVMKQGFDWQCNLDCLDRFYVAPNVACTGGATVAGIGYGHNDRPVVAHAGIWGLIMTSRNEVSRKVETVQCNPNECDPMRIIPGTETKLTILGSANLMYP